MKYSRRNPKKSQRVALSDITGKIVAKKQRDKPPAYNGQP